MDKFMDNFLTYKGFAPALMRRDVPAGAMERFRGRLPDQLLTYWQAYGWCGYAQGLLWTVNPGEWADTLAAWLAPTPFAGMDQFHVIARSAFGELVVWGEASGECMKIVPAHGWLFPAFDDERFQSVGPDLAVQLFFATSSRSTYDTTLDDGTSLFERALAKLGPLDHDTLYGFSPALALGGELTVANLQKVNALAHLDILQQLTPLQVMSDVAQMAKG